MNLIDLIWPAVMTHEEARTIMRRIAMDYDRLAKLAEVQLILEAIDRNI